MTLADCSQIFCQLHDNERRYGLINNLYSSQAVYLENADIMQVSDVVDRAAGSRASKIGTIASLLVVTALKQWEVCWIA